MIAFDLRIGDVLEAKADALIVPIDGTFLPQGGQFERLLGNVGRQLLRRFVDSNLLEEIEAQVDLPLSRWDEPARSRSARGPTST